MKSVFKSKTLWANAILAVVAFIPSLKTSVTPEMLGQIGILVNIVLRLVTKDKLFLTE